MSEVDDKIMIDYIIKEKAQYDYGFNETEDTSSEEKKPSLSENLMHVSVYFDSFNTRYIINKKVYEVSNSVLPSVTDPIERNIIRALVRPLQLQSEVSSLFIWGSQSQWSSRWSKSFSTLSATLSTGCVECLSAGTGTSSDHVGRHCTARIVLQFDVEQLELSWTVTTHVAPTRV